MSTTALVVRDTVGHSDLDVVRNIVSSSGFFSPEEVEIAVQLVQERLTRGEASGYHFLFAEREADVIGYVCFGHIAGTKESFDLYWIAVRNDSRGSGLGKQLLAKAEEDISRRGGRRVYIETSSRQQYQPTRSFYQRCGYHQEAVLKDFYSPGDAKVIYVKDLNSSVASERQP